MVAVKTVCEKARCLVRNLLDFLGRAKLVTIYGWIFFISVAVWGISGYCSNRILRNSIQSEYTEYNEALFEQTISDISRGVNDLVQISYTIMSSKNINDFLLAERFTERVSLLDEVSYESNQLRTIQSYIAAINLYDSEGHLIANNGIVTSPDLFVSSGAKSAISFTGLIEIDKDKYFGVQIPIYSVENSRVKALSGYCYMLISMSFLESRISDVFDSGGAWCVLVSEDARVLLERGSRPTQLQDLENLLAMDEEEMEEELIYQGSFGRAGWRIIFGVSDKIIIKEINRLQRINLITCFSTGLLILALLIGIYASFLRPVNRQIQFMSYYAVDRRNRMEVRSKNEMGMLAENLNAMLDDIDRLNDENLQAQKRLLDAEYQKKQSELLAYRSQINPHFMYNTFECIRGMALHYEVPDIAAISEALASFFTYNIRGKGYAPLQEIREHIQDYASIIGYRFMNRFRIECRIDEAVLNCIFPKMVIQPLVENAIFHGLETTEQDGVVRVEIGTSDGYLSILVTDDGCGMDEETVLRLRMRLKEYDRTNLLPGEKHGIGMVNIYRRLRMFYGQDFSFSITSKIGCGTSVRILVPEGVNIAEEEYVPGFFD